MSFSGKYILTRVFPSISSQALFGIFIGLLVTHSKILFYHNDIWDIPEISMRAYVVLSDYRSPH